MNKCPKCKKIIEEKKSEWFPFCSERCKKIDLGKWFGEEYRVPGEKVQVETEEQE